MEGTVECRINKLPDSALLHMLCFLPIKAAARTSILSKRWRRLWTAIPSLAFDEKDFPSRQRSGFSLDGTESTDLFTIVNQVLLNHDRFLRSLCLRLTLRNDSDRRVLGSWIRHAIVVNQVEELSLQISYSDRSSGLYELPLHLCDCRSICHLKLSGSHFCSRPGREVVLSSLQSLSLHGVHSTVADFPRMLDACPQLEKLVIHNCSKDVTEDVQISATRLLSLSIKGSVLGKIKMIAPSLQFIDYDCHDSPSDEDGGLRKVLVDDTSRIRSIAACACIFRVLGRHGDGVGSPKLDELKVIVLRPCSWILRVESLLSLLRISPSLRSLCIEDFRNLSHPFTDAAYESAGLVLMHLQNLNIRCFSGNEEEQKLVKHILKAASSLEYNQKWWMRLRVVDFSLLKEVMGIGPGPVRPTLRCTATFSISSGVRITLVKVNTGAILAPI
ncbi:F-box/LRR-repeat protein At1g55660-like isoform X2 [Nymphaea colorata]|uniref:F-box/LRR-repeat protein At1g55660-like isoform X2 n=1 Tax=Nymphaea colorata TaxID=210225 RepID=UPI00129E6C74|nr:F-box/LRR-repeat protein At1g55660-like isoform X2 [Nymphaea colorata]